MINIFSQSQSLTAEPGHWPMLILDQKPPWSAQLQGFRWGIHSSHSAVTGRLESNITNGYGQFTQDTGNFSLEPQLQSSGKGLQTACIVRKIKQNLLLAITLCDYPLG